MKKISFDNDQYRIIKLRDYEGNSCESECYAIRKSDEYGDKYYLVINYDKMIGVPRWQNEDLKELMLLNTTINFEVISYTDKRGEKRYKLKFKDVSLPKICKLNEITPNNVYTVTRCKRINSKYGNQYILKIEETFYVYAPVWQADYITDFIDDNGLPFKMQVIKYKNKEGVDRYKVELNPIEKEYVELNDSEEIPF